VSGEGRQRLISSGLVREIPAENGRTSLEPLWTVKETWYWDQVFPAGRDVVIEHRYQPGAGGIVATAARHPIPSPVADGQARIARYCMDSAFLGAIDRIAQREGTEIPSISETWVSYIPHHRRRLALADRRVPACGRETAAGRPGQLLR
jgi:hypothetical protein